MKRAKMIRREREMAMAVCHAMDRARIEILRRVMEDGGNKNYVSSDLINQIFGWEHPKEGGDE